MNRVRAHGLSLGYDDRLPQSALSPEGIRVKALVRRGRYAHQTMLNSWSRADEEATDRAMDAAGVTELADRPVSELSGGQRQRVWVASGPPAQVVTPELVDQIFGMDCVVVPDPVAGSPMIVPLD
ncbi:hypothetical protein NCCP2495_11030 [Dietzia sp. NCCP-2495]|uniref:ABC transporter ATP-binding protein n=1 Tax=Dietzia sp. NCCP-2495 TaxID=2934675 RepID=UPI00222F422D|nr:ABC transporter ATP-binding protein [Dietzia sp. NCCP-2495]GLB63225.1 hypothetical protein NCCP2495_11030 [Dietzia sp. NCCP-2495]